MPDLITDPFDVPFEARPLDALTYRATSVRAPWLIFAHGAGAGQHSGFITTFARGLAARGVTVTTFDFPYMQQRRKAPDRAPVLEAAWTAVLRSVLSEAAAASGVFVGGKSMGGRIASQVLASSAWWPPSVFAEAGPDSPKQSRKRSGGPSAATVRGLVLLGYPLYPPGRPDQRRTAHLPQLRVPVLIVQGERDAFGAASEVEAAFEASPAPVRVIAIEGGDHSFKVPRTAGPQRAVDERIRDTVTAWMIERTQTEST